MLRADDIAVIPVTINSAFEDECSAKFFDLLPHLILREEK